MKIFLVALEKGINDKGKEIFRKLALAENGKMFSNDWDDQRSKKYKCVYQRYYEDFEFVDVRITPSEFREKQEEAFDKYEGLRQAIKATGISPYIFVA